MTSTPSMLTSTIVERSSVDTRLPYHSAVEAFERAVGYLDPAAAAALAARGASWSDVEAMMAKSAGPSGLMILAKFDQGAIASLADGQIRCRLYMVGNPATAAQIVRIDLRACLYVPFRVAIHAPNAMSGATISFDRPSSSLRTLNHPELEQIGQMLDQKIDTVVQALRQ